MYKVRNTLALLISPPITAFTFYLLFTDISGGSSSMGFEIFVLLVGIPVAYFISLIIGLPVALYFRRKERLSFLILAIIGFILGFLTYGFVEAVYGLDKIKQGGTSHFFSFWVFKKLLAAGASGAIGALIYGVISGATKIPLTSDEIPKNV
jgi:ABC-type multidrug transport system permease subunit